MTGRASVDQRLIEACRAGDRGAMATLYESCAPRVHSLAFHFFGGDEARAKDVTHRVFLKLFTRLPQFRGDADVTTWLHRLAVNECLDDRRASRRLVDLGMVSDRPSPARHDEGVEREDLGARVRAAVLALPPKLRAAVLLKHFEDLSYQQMADVLGCSQGTVASRLFRGHAALAASLSHLRPPAERRP